MKFHTKGILWAKLIYFHTMGFELKPIELKNPHNSQIWETNFHRFPSVWEYFLPIRGKWMGIHISFPLMDFEKFFLCGLFRHVMFQAYSAIFTTLDILIHFFSHEDILRQVQEYSKS